MENKKIAKINKAKFENSYVEHLHTQKITALGSELNILGDLYLASYDFERIEAKSFIAQSKFIQAHILLYDHHFFKKFYNVKNI